MSAHLKRAPTWALVTVPSVGWTLLIVSQNTIDPQWGDFADALVATATVAAVAMWVTQTIVARIDEFEAARAFRTATMSRMFVNRLDEIDDHIRANHAAIAAAGNGEPVDHETDSARIFELGRRFEQRHP